MSSPEQIQAEIEQTRSSLSENVDRLGDKVSPGKVVGRRVDKVKDSVSTVRDKVMGSSSDGGGVKGGMSSARDTLGSASSSISDAASSVGDAASNAPQAMRRQTQGNPLAAGLIAFGVGWMLSSLAPATEKEKQVAAKVEDKATQLAEPLKQQAQEMASDMKEPLQQATEELKSTASDAASETADQAKSSMGDVKEPLRSDI
jgi:uncharacterized phage infection (PIP) family protein YhgE